MICFHDKLTMIKFLLHFSLNSSLLSASFFLLLLHLFLLKDLFNFICDS
uniref:Uncharacterized protein n=1 Tax=Rhizophora mucronata TaxID=61149 RepID=A0A2P2J4L5_RHIMU